MQGLSPDTTRLTEPAYKLTSKSGNRRIKPVLMLMGALSLGNFASPAAAAQEPKAKLVNCSAGECLEITGHRSDPSAAVHINGNAVSVKGKRSWRVHLPLDTVREWSAPYARSIEISVLERDASSGSSDTAELPIGLLGGTTDLETLEIRAI